MNTPTQPFVLVPSDPTEEMIQDIRDHLLEQMKRPELSLEEHARRIWHKALAARPSPPSPDAGEVEVVARAICDDEWDGSQPPFDHKPPSFGERYRTRAKAAIQALDAYRSTTPPIRQPDGGGR